MEQRLILPILLIVLGIALFIPAKTILSQAVYATDGPWSHPTGMQICDLPNIDGCSEGIYPDVRPEWQRWSLKAAMAVGIAAISSGVVIGVVRIMHVGRTKSTSKK